MEDDPGIHDSWRPFEPIAQRFGVEVQWPDLADRAALGMEDPWAGRCLPRVDLPGHGDALEAPFLADGYAEDWERLERFAVRQRFRAGDEIIRPGHPDRSLIIVVSGRLSLAVVDDAGDERVLGVVGARSLVGETGFFGPGGLPVAVRARGDGELLRLSFSRFEALAASCPLLGRTILLEAGRVAVARLRRAMAVAFGCADRTAAQG
jgi:CRP-like cAMP-binding protein